MNCFPNITTQIIISLENMGRCTATIKFRWGFIYFSGDKAEILQIKEIKTVYFVECVCAWLCPTLVTLWTVDWLHSAYGLPILEIRLEKAFSVLLSWQRKKVKRATGKAQWFLKLLFTHGM